MLYELLALMINPEQDAYIHPVALFDLPDKGSGGSSKEKFTDID